MAQIFQAPLAREFSNTGSIGSGYKYYFYTTGTTTPISTYTTPALSVANAYPVVADSTGRFPPIWVSNLATTKVILKDASNNVIYTQDPAGATSSTTSLNDLDVRPNSYWGLTTGTSTAYVLTANPSISAYSNVQSFTFQAHIENGANPTMAVSGLSALNLKKYTGQGTKVALQAGDLQPTQRYEAFCDGVDIVVLNPRSLPLNVGTAPTLTIATGVVTVTNVGSSYLLDTEGAAATDDLDTINGGNDGEIIYFSSVNSARDVVLKNGTGNIFNPAGYDIILGLSTFKVGLMYVSSIAQWIVISNNIANYIAIFEDQKSSGTAGGSNGSSVGAGITLIRTLNTTVFNNIAGASLSSNQITLPAGTYIISAKSAAYAANGSKSFFRNASDNLDVLIGVSFFTNTTNGYGFSSVEGTVTITSTKVFELRQYNRSPDGGTGGYGLATSSGQQEVYSTVTIQKIA